MNMRMLIIGIVGILVVVGAVFVGLTMIGPMLFGADEGIAETQASNAPLTESQETQVQVANTPAIETPEGSIYKVGTIVYLPERIVNLSGEGPFSVLQVTMVLEFATTKPIANASLEEKPALVEAFKAEIAPVSAMIEDGVNSLISTKSGEDLLTVVGKDELKQELAEVVNTFAPYPVVAVYFTKFFLQ